MTLAGLAERLKPDIFVHALEDLDLDYLASSGIRGIILDVDNTLTRWRSGEVPPEKAAWVERARRRFALCLLSNTIFGRRLRALGESLSIPYLGFWGPARKPSRRATRAALRILDVQARQACIIGDQVFADILAGKRCGLLTVLVDPVDPSSEFIYTRLVRFFERPLRRAWVESEEGSS